MQQVGGRVEPTFFSRYECKYLVDRLLVPRIREYLRPFTRPDGFAAVDGQNHYPVCSLYLDSGDLRLYMQTVGGEKNRFKLRVRTYSDDPTAPAFFEVKSKVNNIVHKRRAGLPRAKARALLNDGRTAWQLGLAGEQLEDVETFIHHVARVAARPVLRVKYLREAYESTGNEPVRVTIDTDLVHAVTLNDDLGHHSGRWVGTPLDDVILEIKFTECFPWWVQDLVRAFGLHQQAVPKYVLSMDHVMSSGRESALALDGMTLPPGRL